MNAIEAATILTLEWMKKLSVATLAILNEQAICKAYGEFYRTIVVLENVEKLEKLPFDWDTQYPTSRVTVPIHRPETETPAK